MTAVARHKGATLGADANHRNAVEAYRDLVPYVQKLRERALSLRAIASRMNDDGHTTRADKPWTAVQVRLVLSRAA